MKKTLQLPIVIIICLVVAGGAFYGGWAMGKTTKSSGANQWAMAGGQNRQAGGMMRNGAGGAGVNRAGGAVSGEIIKADDKSITVQLTAGGSKIIYLSDTSSVTKSVEGTKADLIIGAKVMVNGTANPDGSVVAQFVQIRPDVMPGVPANGQGAGAGQPINPTAPQNGTGRGAGVGR